MKLTSNQFEAATYIFEKAIGQKKSDFELQFIIDSGLEHLSATDLEKMIIEGVEKGLYITAEERLNVYWSLGKRFNRELIPLFNDWLKVEFELGDGNTVYQLMITLSNLDVEVFGADRDGSAFYEIELNLRDAERYLQNLE